eukprot:9510056-Alexandrium_andersonii.AAC.1
MPLQEVELPYDGCSRGVLAERTFIQEHVGVACLLRGRVGTRSMQGTRNMLEHVVHARAPCLLSARKAPQPRLLPIGGPGSLRGSSGKDAK